PLIVTSFVLVLWSTTDVTVGRKNRSWSALVAGLCRRVPVIGSSISTRTSIVRELLPAGIWLMSDDRSGAVRLITESLAGVTGTVLTTVPLRPNSTLSWSRGPWSVNPEPFTTSGSPPLIVTSFVLVLWSTTDVTVGRKNRSWSALVAGLCRWVPVIGSSISTRTSIVRELLPAGIWLMSDDRSGAVRLITESLAGVTGTVLTTVPLRPNSTLSWSRGPWSVNPEPFTTSGSPPLIVTSFVLVLWSTTDVTVGRKNRSWSALVAGLCRWVPVIGSSISTRTSIVRELLPAGIWLMSDDRSGAVRLITESLAGVTGTVLTTVPLRPNSTLSWSRGPWSVNPEPFTTSGSPPLIVTSFVLVLWSTTDVTVGRKNRSWSALVAGLCRWVPVIGSSISTRTSIVRELLPAGIWLMSDDRSGAVRLITESLAGVTGTVLTTVPLRPNSTLSWSRGPWSVNPEPFTTSGSPPLIVTSFVLVLWSTTDVTVGRKNRSWSALVAGLCRWVPVIGSSISTRTSIVRELLPAGIWLMSDDRSGAVRLITESLAGVTGTVLTTVPLRPNSTLSWSRGPWSVNPEPFTTSGSPPLIVTSFVLVLWSTTDVTVGRKNRSWSALVAGLCRWVPVIGSSISTRTSIVRELLPAGIWLMSDDRSGAVRLITESLAGVTGTVLTTVPLRPNSTLSWSRGPWSVNPEPFTTSGSPPLIVTSFVLVLWSTTESTTGSSAW